MRGRFVPLVLGWVLAGFAAVQLGMCAYAYVLGEPVLGFAVTVFVAAGLALPLIRAGRRHAEPGQREALVAVLLLWLVVPAVGTLPLALSGLYGPIDAVFEAISGFTTAGATVLTDFEAVPASLLMYRSLSQWLGGIGIIIVFVAMFPQLGVAGRQLFQTEAPGPTESRLAPRLRQSAAALVSVYLVLTLLASLTFWLSGMPGFHALARALTTVSAGGFSTLPDAAGSFSLPVTESLAILFMFLAGANFSLQYRALSGRAKELIRDSEFRTYLFILLGAGMLLSLLLVTQGASLEGIRKALFQVASILSTTGATTAGLEQWGARSHGLLLVLMLVGGSAGSAAGSIKVIRWLVVLRSTGAEVKRLLHPRAALPLRVGRWQISPDVLRGMTAFFTLYFLVVGTGTVALLALGLPYVTSLGAALSATSLVGIAFNADGSLLDYAALPALAKVVLMFCMYAGRLEIVTVAVLFVPGWWRFRHARRRAG